VQKECCSEKRQALTITSLFIIDRVDLHILTTCYNIQHATNKCKVTVTRLSSDLDMWLHISERHVFIHLFFTETENLK